MKVHVSLGLSIFWLLAQVSCTPVFAQDELPTSKSNSSTAAAPVPEEPEKEEPDTNAGLMAGSEDFNGSRGYSPWGVSFFNWSNLPVKGVDEGEARFTSYNYLSFSYRVAPGRSVALRPEFYISGAGKDSFTNSYEKDSVEFGDIYLQYSDRAMALIPSNVGDIGLIGSFRVYLPNSEPSRRTKMVTQLQSRLIFTRPFGYGWAVNYHLRPKYFVQANRTYLTEFGNVRATKFAEIEQFVEVTKAFSPIFGLSQQIGPTHTWYNASDANNIQQRVDGRLALSTAAVFLIDGVSFKGGLSYESDVFGRPGRKVAIYDPDETNYFLMTNLFF